MRKLLGFHQIAHVKVVLFLDRRCYKNNKYKEIPMSANLWTSLEIAKLAIEFLTPLAVIGIGLFINRRLKQIEHIQWSNQKIIEKRIELYDRLSPLLNRLLCFYTWIGYWRDISPK